MLALVDGAFASRQRKVGVVDGGVRFAGGERCDLEARSRQRRGGAVKEPRLLENWVGDDQCRLGPQPRRDLAELQDGVLAEDDLLGDVERPDGSHEEAPEEYIWQGSL